MIDPAISARYTGDCRELLKQMPDACVQTCVTSPPYWGLRDYGHAGQLGLEPTPELFVANLVEVFRGVRRVLRDDGTLWINLGDSYAGTGSGPQGATGEMADRAVAGVRSNVTKRGDLGGERPGACRAKARGPRSDGLKSKDLVGVPWMVAFALRADGWYLRSDIIWHKPNAMPESVTDRPSKAHEYIFLLSKSERYFYDADAIREPLSASTLRDHATGRARKSKGADGTRFVASENWASRAPVRKPRLKDGKAVGANKRTVWTVATQPYSGAHFATFPPRLIEPCILAGSRVGDVVLDPFFGSGTTGAVAEMHGRRWIGFDLGYAELAKDRLAKGLTPPKPKRARRIAEQKDLPL